MELGQGNQIKVARASIGFTQASGLEMGVNAMSMFAGTTSSDFEESRVLCLMNMVTAEELIDNEEYEGTSDVADVQLARFAEQDSRNLRGHPRRVFEIRTNY